jgi:tetratricopeptide (TPR) repeat protein
MTDDQILKLNTGQDTSFKKILSSIQRNQNQEISKHIVVSGPCGSGKSFLLRRLQIHFTPYKTIACFLFPETPTNIFHPEDFLKAILSFISCNYAFQLLPKWNAESYDQWQFYKKSIDLLMDKSPYNHVIICMEQLQRLIEKGAFSSECAQERLKTFLMGSPWLTFVTTQNGCRLSNKTHLISDLFINHQLPAWNENDHRIFIHKFLKQFDLTDDIQRTINYQALTKFTGGTPRNAIILADILCNDHLISVTHALEKSLDMLTPFYEKHLFDMQPEHRILLDALIRGGEPCSINDLANRVNANLSEIEKSLSWMIENMVLTQENIPSHESVCWVTDRLLTHYYRMRHIQVQHRAGMLAAVSEFLVTFYHFNDLKQYAENYYNEGNVLIARELMHISLSHVGLNIKSLPWKNDIPSLFKALNFFESNHFELPKSEKKFIFQREQMKDLLIATQFGPDQATKKRLGQYLSGSLFLDEKKRHFLFQKCIQNRLSNHQWKDLDIQLTIERIRLRDEYGDTIIRLMDLIASGELIPAIIRESRLKRLKNENIDIYHALIAFFSDQFSFSLASSEIFDAHHYCLKKLKNNSSYHLFHLEKMGWHKGCLQEFKSAIHYFEKALKLFHPDIQNQKKAWLLSQLGWCHQSLKNYDHALTYHEKACQYFSHYKDRINHAWNMGCIARIYGKLKKYEMAIEKHYAAIDLLIENLDDEQLAWNWSRIARNMTRLKRYDDAMEAHNTALKIIEIIHNKELEAWNLEGMAWIYGKIHQYDEAIKTQQQALKIRSNENNISQQAWNLEGIGWSLGKLERYEEALKVLNRALKIRETTQHILGQAWNLEGIARYLGNLGRHDEAISAHERALLLQIQEKNDERQIWNYRGIAWNYKEINDYDQSIVFLEKALKQAESSENGYWQASLLGLMGWNFRQSHRLNESISAHEKAISLYQKHHNSSAILENVGQIAINYFILGYTGRAWHILDHYGSSTKKTQKMISRIGDAVIYLAKNVRKETAFKTGTNIVDGIWFRRKRWDISPIMQCFFLSLIKAKIDNYLLHRLAGYFRRRCGKQLAEPFHIIFALITYIHSGRNRQILQTMDPDQRRAVESLIESIGI